MSESDSDSFYELAAIEEAELGQEAEDLASMPDSTLQIRIFSILDWLEVSPSSLGPVSGRSHYTLVDI